MSECDNVRMLAAQIVEWLRDAREQGLVHTLNVSLDTDSLHTTLLGSRMRFCRGLERFDVEVRFDPHHLAYRLIRDYDFTFNMHRRDHQLPIETAQVTVVTDVDEEEDEDEALPYGGIIRLPPEREE